MPIRKSPAKRSALAGAAAFLLALFAFSEREAHAGDGDKIAALIGVNIGVADMFFWSYDIAVTARGERSARGIAIAQLAFVGPQALIMTGVLAEVDSRGRSEELIPAYIGTSLLGGMTAYGALALRFKDMRGFDLFTMSQAFSTDVLFTANMAFKAVTGNKMNLGLAITELSMTAPALVYSVYKVAADEEWRPMWIGISAWTGTLALHGLVTTVMRAMQKNSGNPYASLNGPAVSLVPNTIRLPFKIDRVGPGVLSDGVNTVPGLEFAGTF